MRIPNRGDYRYEYVTGMQNEIQCLTRRLQAAVDGSGTTRMREKHAAERAGFERKIRSLEKKLCAKDVQIERAVKERSKHWLGVTEEIEKLPIRE